MRSKHNVVVAKCAKCGRSFATQEQVEAHMQEHGGSERYECDGCAQRFETDSRLQLHMAECKDES